MKIEAIQDFRDITNDNDIKVGDVIEVPEDRGNDLIAKGLVKKASIIKRKAID